MTEEEKKKEEQKVNVNAEPVADAAGAGAGNGGTIKLPEMQMNPKKESFEVAGTGSEKLGVSNYADNTSSNGGQKFYGKFSITDKNESQEEVPSKSAYDEIFDRYAEAEKEYKSKRDKIKSNSRTAGIITGIADMAGALGSIYAANKGVPVKFVPTEGLTKRAQERYEKAMAELNNDYQRKQSYIDRDLKYQQVKDNLNYRNRQLDNQINREKRLAEHQAAQEEIERMRIEVAKGTLAYKEAKLQIDAMYNDKRISAQQYKYYLDRIKEDNKDYEETRTKVDSRGNVETVTTEKIYGEKKKDVAPTHGKKSSVGKGNTKKGDGFSDFKE